MIARIETRASECVVYSGVLHEAVSSDVHKHSPVKDLCGVFCAGASWEGWRGRVGPGGGDLSKSVNVQSKADVDDGVSRTFGSEDFFLNIAHFVFLSCFSLLCRRRSNIVFLFPPSSRIRFYDNHLYIEIKKIRKQIVCLFIKSHLIASLLSDK